MLVASCFDKLSMRTFTYILTLSVSKGEGL
jgi:hypothetical protein